MQPTHPPGIFLPRHVETIESGAQAYPGTMSACYGSPTCKGMTSPIIDSIARCNMRTLKERDPESPVMEYKRDTGSASESRAAAHRITNARTQLATVASPSHDFRMTSMSLPNPVIDTFERTEENDDLRMFDSPTSGPSPADFTTLMLCDFPRKVTQECLARGLDDLGFAGTYDLVYIPKGIKDGMGYGFVNFRTAEAARSFWVAFDGIVFPGYSSNKLTHVRVAKTQGLTETVANIRRGGNYRKRCHAPLLFHNARDLYAHEFGIGEGGAFL